MMDVLVVDGYNIIGAWDELKRLKEWDISQARDRLIEILSEYRAYVGYRVIIVFDALYVKGGQSRQEQNDVEIIYTKENETADECIEGLVKSLKNVKNQVYVATSDYDEQKVIFGRGALRISARELLVEINSIDQTIKQDLAQYDKSRPQFKINMDESVLEQFEKWRRGGK